MVMHHHKYRDTCGGIFGVGRHHSLRGVFQFPASKRTCCCNTFSEASWRGSQEQKPLQSSDVGLCKLITRRQHECSCQAR